MKSLKKICIAFAFVIFLILLTSSVNAAASFNLNKMNFDITLNSDGTMDIVETWDIKVKGTTNTLFKNFIFNKQKFSGIENVYVKEVKDGNEISFTKINKEMYHVTKNCYYALINNTGRFEIAWGINEKSGRKTYKIYYTVKDAIKTYNDCSQLYWQFIGEEFEKNIADVQGTIKLPVPVSNIENLKVWAHGQLNGEIRRVDESTVKFFINSFKNGNYCEVRIVTTEDIFKDNLNRKNENCLNDILEEERIWAEEANRKREEKRLNNLIMASAVIIMLIVEFIILTIRINKNSKELKKVPKMAPTQKLDYFREIPNELASPAGAVFLRYNKGIISYMPKVISATMLSLCLKKALIFEIQKNVKGKDELYIKLNKKADLEKCKDSEKRVYELLAEVTDGKEEKFTMKQLEKHVGKHQIEFYTFLDKMGRLAEEEQCKEMNYDKEVRKKHDSWLGKATILVALGIFSMFGTFMGIAAALGIGMQLVLTMLILTISTIGVFIADIAICSKFASRYIGLTQKGYDEEEKWKALQKYMEDFSLLKEREVPELVLWEKYLVFATAFGVADKVVSQLKIIYPEFLNESSLNSYSYLYLMNNSAFSTSFINSLNSSVGKVYSTGTMSSSSGGGGGFSGGGGGGGRWRRRRRSLKYYKFKLKKEKLFNIKKVYMLAKQA